MTFRHFTLSWAISLLALTSTSLLLSMPSLAAESSSGQSFGTVYLSAAPDAHVRSVAVDAMETFQFFLVSEVDYGDIGRPDQNEANGIGAWEAHLSFPPELIVTSAILEPADSYNFLTPPSWAVGIPGYSRVFTHEPKVLVRLSGFVLHSEEPRNLQLRVGPVERTSFPDSPGPGWVDHDPIGECFMGNGAPSTCKRLFSEVRGMRVRMMSGRGVKTESTTWGTVKANFGS